MSCHLIPGGIICLPRITRLPLSDGSRVFVESHHYLGPTFYRDRYCQRLIDDWYENPLIVDAWDWFYGRGERG